MKNIDPLSLTWIALKAEITRDREFAVESLTLKGVCPREADFLRGHIHCIDHLLTLADDAEARNPTP